MQNTEESKRLAIEQLTNRVVEDLVQISHHEWQKFSRPAMMAMDEKKERQTAVRLAFASIKKEFIKNLTTKKVEGII